MQHLRADSSFLNVFTELLSSSGPFTGQGLVFKDETTEAQPALQDELPVRLDISLTSAVHELFDCRASSSRRSFLQTEETNRAFPPLYSVVS